MALAGTLKDFSLADIFQLISFQRKTGVLTLKNLDQTVTVSVINGAIVSADSLPKRLDDHLGQVLVRQGIITADQLEKALQTQRETMQKMGYILTHSNFITIEALKEALQTQISQIIYRLFKWTDGHYEFAQTDAVEYDKDYISPIQIENVLMEGMRMLDEWPIINKKILNFQMVFRGEIGANEYVVEGSDEGDSWGHDGAAAENKIKLSPNEHMVFRLVDGVSTVQTVVDRCRLTEFDTCRALYDLLSRNLISDVSAKHAQAAKAAHSGIAALAAGRAAEQRDFSPLLLGAVLLAIAAGLVLGVAKPFQMLYRFSPNMMDLAESRSTERFVDMMRVAEKVRVFYLHRHQYPASLKELVKAGLATAQELSENGKARYELRSEDSALFIVDLASGISLAVDVDVTLPASGNPEDESSPVPGS